MFELFVVVLFAWLMLRAIGLAVRITWGLARIVASLLMAIALPALILCLLFAGGIALLIPIAAVAAAAGILRAGSI